MFSLAHEQEGTIPLPSLFRNGCNHKLLKVRDVERAVLSIFVFKKKKYLLVAPCGEVFFYVRVVMIPYAWRFCGCFLHLAYMEAFFSFLRILLYILPIKQLLHINS